MLTEAGTTTSGVFSAIFEARNEGEPPEGAWPSMEPDFFVLALDQRDAADDPGPAWPLRGACRRTICAALTIRLMGDHPWSLDQLRKGRLALLVETASERGVPQGQ